MCAAFVGALCCACARARALTPPSLLAGGKLQIQYVEKKAKGPRCADTGKGIQGVPRLRPKQYARLQKHERTVSRAYGGVLSARSLTDRILRAFIVEEQKIVKKVLQEKIKMGSRAA